MPKRRIRQVSEQLELDLSVTSELLGLKDVQLRTESLKTYANSLDPTLLVGKVPLNQKVFHLMDGLKDGEAKRVMDQMEASRGAPLEFTAIVETLDYSKLRGNLGNTMDALDMDRAEGKIIPPLMKQYLEVGEVYDNDTRGMTERQHEFLKDYIEGVQDSEVASGYTATSYFQG